MLYKKIHRQYLREFRVGMKFKTSSGEVYEVTEKPQIIMYEFFNRYFDDCISVSIIELVGENSFPRNITLINKFGRTLTYYAI